MAVVGMQASGVLGQRLDACGVRERDAGAAHAGVEVDEAAARPALGRLLGVDEHRDRGAGMGGAELVDAVGVGADRVVREQDVLGSELAEECQLAGVRALQPADVAGEHQLDHRRELRRLDVRPPALWAAEQLEHAIEVELDRVEVDRQRGGEHARQPMRLSAATVASRLTAWTSSGTRSRSTLRTSLSSSPSGAKKSS